MSKPLPAPTRPVKLPRWPCGHEMKNNSRLVKLNGDTFKRCRVCSQDKGR